MTVFYLLIYFSLLVFASAVIARIIRIARMPLHLRWELYPVPHEKGRARYGGSTLEEVDWWTKPRKVDRLAELGVMIPEILFLKGVWEHNRPLWFSSFTLHFGLYLLIAELGFLALAGLLTLAGLEAGIMIFLSGLIQVLAWAGCIIGAVGATLMLIKRLTDRRMRSYSTPSHFFNLLLLEAIYVTGFVWVIIDPGYAPHLVDFFAGWMSASALPVFPLIGYWHVGFVLFFFVYFPFTHMTHAFVKWFTYHDVRWEDEPNLPGGKLQAEIDELEKQVVTWAAPHVKADGKKTWVDIASETGLETKE